MTKERKRYVFLKETNGSCIRIPMVLWIIVGLTFLLLIIMHTYNDILITAKQGYHFWDLLFEGRPLEFYKDASMTTGNEFFPDEQGAAYLFPVYLIFAIWNFPTWLISSVSGTDYFNSIPSMIWMKLMLVPFIIISAQYIYKIIHNTKGKKQYAIVGAFFFVSSILVLYPTALIGQYDIITVAFIMMGIYGWTIGNQKRFLIPFASALLFKYFAFLYFLPLLLLDEKKIRRIILKIFIVVLPIFPFLLFPKPKGQSSNVSELLDMFMNNLQIGENNLYVFPFVVAIVLILCFFKELDSANRIQYAYFYLLIIMGAFCVLINPYPYWCILAVPAILLAAINSNNMNKVFILEMVLSLGITVKNYIIFYWCFGIKTVAGMGIINNLLGKSDLDVSLQTSLLNHKFFMRSSTQYWIFTVLMVAFVLIIYFAYPKVKKVARLEPFCLATIYSRTALNILVAIAPTVYLFIYILLKG